jgi:hypothetical protein
MNRKITYRNYYDVVILPPARVREYAIQLSREIRKLAGVKFTLAHTRYVPHISLYHIPVRPGHLPEFRKTLQRILAKNRLGFLRLGGIKLRAEGEAIWIGVTKPEWLLKLHRCILKETMKFRDKEFDVEMAWNHFTHPLQKKNIKVYGSPCVMRLFKPHITVTVLKGQIPDLKSLPYRGPGFKVSAISLFRLGPSHTCHKRTFTIYPPKS